MTKEEKKKKYESTRKIRSKHKEDLKEGKILKHKHRQVRLSKKNKGELVKK